MPAVTAVLGGETSGLRSIRSCMFRENVNGNSLEIQESMGSICRGILMPRYFLQSAWVGKLESYEEGSYSNSDEANLRYQKNPNDFDIFNRRSISSIVLFM